MSFGMWSAFLWFLLLICNVWRHADARTENVCTSNDRPHPQGVCGNRIPEMLSLICMFGYNEPEYGFRRKRGSTDLSIDGSGLRDLIIPRTGASSYLEKRGEYFMRGIVCECCYNSCSISELYSYCR